MNTAEIRNARASKNRWSTAVAVFLLAGAALTFGCSGDQELSTGEMMASAVDSLISSGPVKATRDTILSRILKMAAANPMDWGSNPFLANPQTTRLMQQRTKGAPKKRSGGKKSKKPAWTLSGLLSRQGRSVAIINNKVVMVGDEVKGYKVSEIGQDFVRLTGARGEVVVRMKTRKQVK